MGDLIYTCNNFMTSFTTNNDEFSIWYIAIIIKSFSFTY